MSVKNYFIAFLLASMPWAYASQLTWQSPSGAVNLQSDGVTTLDSSFEFLVGAFPAAFTPTESNLEEWVNQFVPLGDPGIYLDGSQRFTRVATLTSNASPFERTNRVYIWGRNGTTSGSEWILMSRPVSEWTWAVGSSGFPPIPGGPEYRVSDVQPEDVVLGSVNDDGALMRTASVAFTLSYDDWVLANFDEGDDSSPTADIDGDGLDNLLEYAVGSDPQTADAETVLEMTSDFQLVIERVPGRLVNWEIESSTTLQNFAPFPTGLELLEDLPSRLVYRITDRTDVRRFFRARVSLQ